MLSLSKKNSKTNTKQKGRCSILEYSKTGKYKTGLKPLRQKPAFRFGILLTAVIYWVCSSRYHHEVAFFVVSFHNTPYGAVKPADYALIFGIISLFLFLVCVFAKWKNTSDRIKTVFYTLFWLLLMLLTDRYLISTPNEYVHFPQYGLLGFLFSLSADPEKKGGMFGLVMGAAIFLGILDETFQYLVIQPEYTSYYDFNDMVMNTLGCIGGMLFYYAFQTFPEMPHKHAAVMIKRFCFIIILTAIISGSLLLSGIVRTETKEKIPPGGVMEENGHKVIYLERKPNHYGRFLSTDHHGRYYILTPLEGIAAVFVLAGAFQSFTVTYRRNC